MSDRLQQAIHRNPQERRWPAEDLVDAGGGKQAALFDGEALRRIPAQSPPSSPAGYNPYWDLPPA